MDFGRGNLLVIADFDEKLPHPPISITKEICSILVLYGWLKIKMNVLYK
jgi:hypothetical protein